jgi:nucleoside-diphosphate-sugar epimerase
MILVVGATGMLGREICQWLAQRGEPVRALVRMTSATERSNCCEDPILKHASAV